MANRLKMAHERRKIQLRGAILQGRAKIANEQERLKRFRDELKSMSPARAQGPNALLAPVPRSISIK